MIYLHVHVCIICIVVSVTLCIIQILDNIYCILLFHLFIMKKNLLWDNRHPMTVNVWFMNHLSSYQTNLTDSLYSKSAWKLGLFIKWNVHAWIKRIITLCTVLWARIRVVCSKWFFFFLGGGGGENGHNNQLSTIFVNCFFFKIYYLKLMNVKKRYILYKNILKSKQSLGYAFIKPNNENPLLFSGLLFSIFKVYLSLCLHVYCTDQISELLHKSFGWKCLIIVIKKSGKFL